MELFENILTGEKSSKYKTNHFHMFVDDDVLIPDVENMSDDAFGTLIHEYVHYIQHITTLFGIRTCSMFHKISILYRTYISDHDKIELPLELCSKDENIKQYLQYFKNVSGSKTFGYNVDAVDISPNDVEDAKNNRTAVKIACYDFANNAIYEDKVYFGYICIMESMAHCIQHLFCEELTHTSIPYCSAELVLKELYPQISTDYKLIASICYCALSWDNPGVGFFEVVEILKHNPKWNGIQLYQHIAQDYSVKYEGESMPRFRLLQKFMNDFILYLKQLLGVELDYYKKVMDSCVLEAGTSMSILLDAIYNVALDDKRKFFETLANQYGYPLIDANNATVLPNKSFDDKYPKPYIETAVLFGWELLLSRFMEFDGKQECDRLPICMKDMYSNSNCVVSQQCSTAPWLKKEACPFTECMRYYQMSNKTFVSNHSRQVLHIS
nr:hypothetical protein [Prevotella sp.]